MFGIWLANICNLIAKLMQYLATKLLRIVSRDIWTLIDVVERNFTKVLASYVKGAMKSLWIERELGRTSFQNPTPFASSHLFQAVLRVQKSCAVARKILLRSTNSTVTTRGIEI